MMVKLKSLGWWYLTKVYQSLVRSLALGAYKALMGDGYLSSKDFETIKNRTRCEGLNFLSQTLPKLAKALEAGISSGQFECPTSFKKAGHSRLPCFMGFWFDAIFDSEGFLRDEVDPSAVAAIRQVCYYVYKADLPMDESKSTSVIDNFVETEKELLTLSFENDAILEMASSFIAHIFKDYQGPYVPKHGPGITSDTPLHQKWSQARKPGRCVAHFAKLFALNSSAGFDDALKMSRGLSTTDYFKEPERAKVILVPKDSRGPRLISCEPRDHQFIQQGILDYMVKTLESNLLTSGEVNFTDQSVNQSLARQGSITLGLATLDLKDASDRNSLLLFNHLFKKCPKLRDDILACRTNETVLPDGRVVSLSKFAPMGSALCFPVMAVSLWALIKASFVGMERYNSTLSIYGDDIIVESDLAHFVCDVIEKYGFRVNRSKSFIASRFCESCGGDYFDGVNVTPTRMRSIWNIFLDPWSSPKTLVRMCKHAQEFDPASDIARYWYGFVEQLVGKLPPGLRSSPYLCRIDSVNQVKKGLSRHAGPLFFVKTKNPVANGETGWQYLYRIWRGIGRNDRPVAFGYQDLPRRWYLNSRRLTKSLLDSLLPK